MPTTYNGIGTHYYGRKNLHRRSGHCQHCGRQGELASYDTRLWFVILYLPIFPVGRKRIVDHCPHCTRHFAMDAEKWEASKRLELSGALEKYRASQSPGDAIALHQQFLNFHQFDQAAEFRKAMRAKFADNAEVHSYLGAALEHFGQHEEAAACFARALNLRTDLPEARIGVARSLIQGGRLDEARRLLDFLEKPGASKLYSLERLDELARAFQNAGRHEEALGLFATIQRELPRVAEEKWFRTLVARSEKAAHRAESQLPKQKFSLKRLLTAQPAEAGKPSAHLVIVLGVLAALVLLGFAVTNEYIRRHRTLHVVNAWTTPATLRIENGPTLANLRHTDTLELAEGRHRAFITGPVTETVEFELRAGYFSRWFSEPGWVLNVGRKAVLIRTEATYSSNPRPPRYTVHYGKSFEFFPKLTHPFAELPETVRMKRSESRTLVGLQVHPGDGHTLFGYLQEEEGAAAALDFAEQWLAITPDDEVLLRAYAGVARQTQATNRLHEFLRSGLAARPLRIAWHRVYQNLHDGPAEHAALVAEYETRLQAEPASSALLYLRGRLEADRHAARGYFMRATNADPANPFPIYALGFDRISAADWPAGRELLGRAGALRPGDPVFQHWLHLARAGAGEAAALEQEARAALARNATDLSAMKFLLDSLALQNRREEAQRALASFEHSAATQYGERAPALSVALRCRLHYLFGEFAEMDQLATRTPKEARAYRVQSLLELGQPEAALKLVAKPDEAGDQPLFDFAVALSFRQAGNAAGAEHWVEQARQQLAEGNEDEARLAKLIARRSQGITVEALKDISAEPQLKAAVAAYLAASGNPDPAGHAAFARALNVERSFPHHLIQRAAALRP